MGGSLSGLGYLGFRRTSDKSVDIGELVRALNDKYDFYMIKVHPETPEYRVTEGRDFDMVVVLQGPDRDVHKVKRIINRLGYEYDVL